MQQQAIDRAAALLIEARRTGVRLDRLPEPSRPASMADAYAIQIAAVAKLGETIAGWKAAESAQYGLMFGILLKSRMLADGAEVPAAEMPMLGVEAEIAFRFDRSLPPRDEAYSPSEVAAAVTALPAIEIVDTRFRDFEATPPIERAADFMSSGGFVAGAARGDWRAFDLASLEAVLMIDGKEIVRRVGGHASGDPLVPAVALANELRLSTGIPAGRVVTTGTFTGLTIARPGGAVRTIFEGFGSVGCRFLS